MPAGTGGAGWSRLAAIHLLFRYATLRVARVRAPASPRERGRRPAPAGPSRCPPARADRAGGKGTGGSAGRRGPTLHGTGARQAIIRMDDFPLSLSAVDSPE